MGEGDAHDQSEEVDVLQEGAGHVGTIPGGCLWASFGGFGAEVPERTRWQGCQGGVGWGARDVVVAGVPKSWWRLSCHRGVAESPGAAFARCRI
jgi:hypothetical protein